MRVLAVPNWSFGRNRSLLQKFSEVLDTGLVWNHYCKSDPDHNRTVTAFSGDSEAVRTVLLNLCEIAFDTIDLNRHVGVHPRVGALDVCPFVLLEGSSLDALALAEDCAARIATTFQVPVYLYEKSERGRHEIDLPTLRRGGFGALEGKLLTPDFGPDRAHPRLGIVIMGVRGFLIAMNINFATPEPSFAKELAKRARELRSDGDPRFLGVRALGFPLASREQSQLSLNLTLPDLASVDPIVDWAMSLARQQGITVASTELIGVIRESDMPTATHLRVEQEQVVATE